MNTDELRRTLMASENSKEGSTRSISWEDVVALNRLNEALEKVSIETLLAKKEEQKTDLDKLVDKLKAGGKLDRAIRKAKQKKRKQHWRTAKRKRRQYYEAVASPRRKQKLAEQLTTAEGWWEHITSSWKRKKQTVLLTEDEWHNVLWPALAGHVFIVQRYDPAKPISLDNIYVTRTATGEVLFDGKEHLLRMLGYVL